MPNARFLTRGVACGYAHSVPLFVAALVPLFSSFVPSWMTLLAAIPPPHVFVNVSSARMLDARTLEMTFEYPRCPDARALAASAMGWSVIDEKDPPPRYSIRVGLQELRARHGTPTCTGPVETQRLSIDLRALVDERIVRGTVQLNDESLYGYMKKLPTLTIPFDFRKVR